jgi:hypothetical protein
VHERDQQQAVVEQDASEPRQQDPKLWAVLAEMERLMVHSNDLLVQWNMDGCMAIEHLLM